MNVQLLHVEVPTRHQGIAASRNLLTVVVLRTVIADLRPLRTIDMDHPGVLLPRTGIAWRRNTHMRRIRGERFTRQAPITLPTRMLAQPNRRSALMLFSSRPLAMRKRPGPSQNDFRANATARTAAADRALAKALRWTAGSSIGLVMILLVA
jgi:hypothetical protein